MITNFSDLNLPTIQINHDAESLDREDPSVGPTNQVYGIKIQVVIALSPPWMDLSDIANKIILKHQGKVWVDALLINDLTGFK